MCHVKLNVAILLSNCTPQSSGMRRWVMDQEPLKIKPPCVFETSKSYLATQRQIPEDRNSRFYRYERPQIPHFVCNLKQVR